MALQPNRIKLEPDQRGSNSFIPHIQVRADGRKLKTKNALRDIPLVGVALAAMQRNPQGFPQYNDRQRTPAPRSMHGYGISSLSPNRVTFKRSTACATLSRDRLHALRVNDAEYVSLMGHQAKGAKYGAVSLETKAAIMNQIAY